MSQKSDGKVIISTELDNSGIEKNLKSMAARLAAEYKRAGADASSAWKKAWADVRKTSASAAQTAIPVIDLNTGQIVQASAEAAGAANQATSAGKKAVDVANDALVASERVTTSLGGTAEAVTSVTASVSAQDEKIQSILADTERSASSKASSIAAIYRKQGYSQQEAFKKAWEKIERNSTVSTKKVGANIRDNIGGATQFVIGQFGGLKNVVRSLGAAIGAAFSVMTIVNFAKESVNAANALSDALTGLKSTLDGQGRSFSDAEKFLQEYTADGLVPMTNAITAYKNLASRGYDDSQIRSVMQALKDASAFGRQASYSMGEAVQSATEGLKNENSVLVDNAGVTKNVAKMWEEYAASIGTTANNLTQAQKIQAEVNGILEESKYQAGDAAKVAGTLSGQLSQLSVNFNNLKVAVGNAIKPIVQSLLPAVNAAVAAMTRFANSVAQVVNALFGNFGTAETVQEVADGYRDAASGAEDLADATEAAGKAAKKYLAGFDEITRIGDSASGAADAVGDSGMGTTVPVTADGEIKDELSPKLKALVDKIMALLEPLKQIDLGPLAASFDRLRTAVEPLTAALFAGLEWAWYNILVPLAAWTIEDLLPAFLDLVSAALGVLNEVILVFQPLATWLWENFLAPVAEWTGGMIVEVLGWITDGLTAISDWIGENQALVEGFITVVASFAAAWALVNGALAIWNGTVAIWNNLGVIASGVTSAFGAAVGVLTSPIGLTVLAIGALIAIIALLVQNWDTVSQVAADVWAGIVDVWSGVCTWFDQNVLTPLCQGFWDTLDNITQFSVDLWNGIVSVWEDVAGWFDRNVLSPLAQGFRDTFNGIIGFINGLISGVQSGINAIIRGINRISFTVPDWVPGIGGLTMGFNLSPVSFPQIPYLAQGAVLPANKPFLAMVGDQRHGTNVEAPLATIQEAVALVMDDYAASNLAGQEAIVEVLREILEAVLGIEIGDDVIGQAVARYNRKMAVVRGGT